MRNACLLAAVLFSLPPVPTPAHAYDAFSDQRSAPHFALKSKDGSKLVFKGWLGLSMRDLEGRGGIGHDSITDTATIGTMMPRAPMSTAFWMSPSVASGTRMNGMAGASLQAQIIRATSW